jgi:coenzyme PQQ synthesis protein D (PqqD)
MAVRFLANSPNVIHETIEGEVILIDLKSGTYYSLREVGAAAWQAMEGGAAEDEIVAALEPRYDAPSAEIREAVRRLVDELEREGLVRPADGDTDRPEKRVVLDSIGAGRLPFAPPVLEKHTDMQDLILLDPVHEVDVRGWPHPADADETRA